MRVEYTTQINDVDSSDDEIMPTHVPQGNMAINTPPPPLLQKWPRIIGIVQIISGAITTMLGALELFIIPLIDFKQPEDSQTLHFTKKNCFGIGIVAGLLMVITGSTAIRASISRRRTTVFRFYNLTVFTLLVYTALSIVLIVGFSLGWTIRSQYPDGSLLYPTHVFLTLNAILGLVFALTAFVQYYEVVFFGELQLFAAWTSCCCPCIVEKIKKLNRNRERESNMPI